jgi:PAS domain S-box-containing protein
MMNQGQDMEDRKQAGEGLWNSVETFKSLFDQHVAVKLVIDPDTGAIVTANHAAAAFYGWSCETLAQMKIQQINILSPDEVREQINNAKDQKQFHFEFRHRLADGSVRDVEVFSNKITMRGLDYLHSIIHDITERKKMEVERVKLIGELQAALAQVKQLSGLLPICASCKKIRDDKGHWNQIESYICNHSEAMFSHGICPECAKKLYPKIYVNIFGEPDNKNDQ